MIFNKPDTPRYDYEQILENPTEIPPPPRCSLDFVIVTDNGSLINDSLLKLQSFQGHENLSQLFEFELTLSANDYTSSGPSLGSKQSFGEILNPQYATTKTIDFDSIIGSNATIILGTPETDKDVNEQSYPEQRPVTFFNGIVSSFSLGNRGVYHATLKPALFKLSLQNNYRLFSQSTILQVIIDILSENNIVFNIEELEKQPSNIVMGLANYRKQDWLQAGESDLDFINRLMQKVSLFYYFVHLNKQHKMIITDQPYYRAIYQRSINNQGFNQETQQLKSLYLSYTEQASMDRDDYIKEFKYQQNLITSGITTVLAQKEATWESQNTAQVSPVFFNRVNQKEKLNMQQVHLVQYGATESEVSKLTDTAVNQLAAARFSFSGSSSCAELKSGHKFKIEETWRDPDAEKDNLINQFSSNLPIRPLLDQRIFVATSVQHQASINGDYKNQFSAVAAEGLAMPFNSHSGQQGSILAIVTDKPVPESTINNMLNSITSLFKKKNEINHQGSSAKYLERDVFAYDSKEFQYQDSSNKYSCRGVYVRFIDQPDSASSKWVKLAEHMQTIPEIGSYVTVGRSNDDNEIPEIQQSLQAKGSTVIMPDRFTCNTSVGDSYNTNYGDSTRIGFGTNISTPLKTAQTIVDAKRKTTKYNDVTYNESSSYNYGVTGLSHSVSRLGKGVSLPADDPLMATKVQYSNNSIYGDIYSQSLTNGNAEHHSTTNGNVNSDSEQTGDITSTNTVTGDTDNTSYNYGNTTQNSTTTGKAVNNSTNTGGSSSRSELTGGSYSWSSVDTSNSVNRAGATTAESFTGVSHNFSMTGANSQESVTGINNNMSVTGVNTGLSYTRLNGVISKTTSDNSISSTTNLNSAQIILSGATYKNDQSAIVENLLTKTSIFSTVRVML